MCGSRVTRAAVGRVRGKEGPRSIYRPRKKGTPGKDGKQLNGVKTTPSGASR